MNEEVEDSDCRELLARADAVPALQAYLNDSIPLIEPMQVRVASAGIEGVGVSAPLAPNSNHIGTAFGGSLHGLATLASWGLLWLLLREREDVSIVVRDSRMRYLAPARGELEAFSPTPNPGILNQFFRGMDRRGKAGIELTARVESEGTLCADFEGGFVAVRARDFNGGGSKTGSGQDR